MTIVIICIKRFTYLCKEFLQISKLMETVTKLEHLDILRLEKTSAMLKAMAHPMRIAILKLLELKEKLSVTEIHQNLDLEQSTTSHHLGILKDKGILKSERRGKNTYYLLKNENLQHIVDCIGKCADCDDAKGKKKK